MGKPHPFHNFVPASPKPIHKLLAVVSPLDARFITLSLSSAPALIRNNTPLYAAMLNFGDPPQRRICRWKSERGSA